MKDKISVLEIWNFSFKILKINDTNKCKLFINVMSSRNINNGQLILETLMRSIPQLTQRNQ